MSKDTPPSSRSLTFADWWDTFGRAREADLPIRDKFHVAKMAWEAGQAQRSESASVVYSSGLSESDIEALIKSQPTQIVPVSMGAPVSKDMPTYTTIVAWGKRYDLNMDAEALYRMVEDARSLT